MSGSEEDGKRSSDPNAARDEKRRDIIMGTAPRGLDTRFKPGRSGNPKGRPKKSESEPLPTSAIPVLKAALGVANTPITITEAGVTREISTDEGILRSLSVKGLKGNAYAAIKALEFILRAQTHEANRLEASRNLWRMYKEKCHLIDEAAKLDGRPPQRHLPHPDDVIIEESGPVKVIGPLDDEQQTKLEETLRYRDVLILQHAYDSRFGPRNDDGAPYKSSALVHMIVMEVGIPPRLRLTERERAMRFEAAARTPKLELLKMIRRGWRSVGRTYKRGTIFPTREWGLEVLEVQRECANLISEHVKKGTPHDQFVQLPEVIAVDEKLAAAKARMRW